MNITEIPIVEPCRADWATMTLSDRGRFCGQCRKVVRDLAQMSEKEARTLLVSPPTEGLCVRYIHDTRGEIVFRREGGIPVARLLRKAATTALALGLPVSLAACATAAPPVMGTPPVAGETVTLPVMMGAPMPVSASAPDGGATSEPTR